MAKNFIYGLAGILIAALTALTPLSAAAAGTKTEIKIGISQFPSSLHPMFDAMVAKSYVLGPVIRPMTAHDASWKPSCLLCTEMPSFENGRAKKEKGGIAARYTLKEDLYWDDGRPVIADDVILAWDIGRHAESGVDSRAFFADDIASIDKVDDKNFIIRFSKEKCDFATVNDLYPVPDHLEGEIFNTGPLTYRNRSHYNTAPTTTGLYLGPYRIAKVEQGAFVTLEKNPHWKGKPPAFERVTFRAVENSAALSAHLLSGDIDYIAGEIGTTLDQALSLEKRLKPGQFIPVYKQGLTYEHIDFNLEKQPFSDVRLRQALMHATDREAINKEIFGGRQVPALSNVNPLDSIFTENVKKYPYDPDMAGKLLDEAGWKLKEDGFRYNDKNEKLVIALSTTAGNKSREMIQQAIQADWKKSGITAMIENEPARVLFGDTMRNRSFKGGVMYAWMSSPQNIPKTTMHSTMIPTAENNYGGQNYTGYKNPAADKIIGDLETVCEPDKNRALWHELQKLYAEELPALPLYYRTEAFFIPAWLKGLVPTGHQYPSTLWIEDWSVEK